MRLLLALAVLLALLVVALVAGGPRVARPLLETALSAALGHPVSIAALSWNPAQGRLVAEGIRVDDPAGPLAVERVTVVVDLAGLDRRHLTIAHIGIERPSGAIALDDDYRPVLGAPGGGGGAPSSPIPLTVRELAISDGTLAVRLPQPDAEAVTVHVERAAATGLELGPGGALQFAARLKATVDGAPLTGAATVQLTAATRQISATVEAKQVAVRAGLLPLPPPLDSLTGTLGASAEVEIADDPPRQEVRLALRLADVRLDGPGGSALAAAAVSVPGARIDLQAQHADLGPITVERPAVQVDLTAAEAGDAGSDGDAGAAAGAPGWSVRSGALTVRGGEVRVRRGEHAAALQLDTVRWAGLGDGPVALTLSAAAPGGGLVAADGTLAVAPFAAALSLRAEALPVRPWALLVDLPLQPARGTVTGTVQLDYRDGLRRIEGRIRAEDLHSAPPDPARPIEVMAVATATADLVVVPDGTPAVDVSSLTLSYPYAMVVHGPQGTFPYSALRGSDGGAGAAGADSATSVRIRAVEIEAGKVELIDDTVTPAFWTSLTGVSGTAEDIVLPAFTVERFALSGKRDELSPMTLSGAITADGVQGRAEAQDVLLDSLNPYVTPLLGYKIVSGRLSTVAVATPDPPLLESNVEILLRGLDVLQTGSDVIYEQSGVPLPIALGLISSPGGKIDLTLPMSIDTRSGAVSVGSVVGQALRKAIVTALTSPLRILGSLFGSKGAPHAFAVDPIPFPTGSATLDAAGTQRVGAIARILQAQQNLLLVLLPQVTAEDIAAVGDAQAAELAAGRVAEVRKAFVETAGNAGLPESRVILAPWTPATGAAATGRPGVYVELQDAS